MHICSIVQDFGPIFSSIFSAKHMAPTYAAILWESFCNCHANIFWCTRNPIKVELPHTVVLHLPVLPSISRLSYHCSVVVIIIDIFQGSEILLLIFLGLLIKAIAMGDFDVVIRIFTCHVLLGPCATCDVEDVFTWEGTVPGWSVLAEVLGPPFSNELYAGVGGDCSSHTPTDFLPNKRIWIITQRVHSLSCNNPGYKWLCKSLSIKCVVGATNAYLNATADTMCIILHCRGQ